MKTNWLDRRIAAPGPYLCLCLSQEEFNAVLKWCNIKERIDWLQTDHCHARVHFMTNQNGQQAAAVCLSSWLDRNPIEIAGLLVHEAVHIWQEYAEWIGEKTPGKEQEAYAIQSIAQELLAEFAKRMGAG